MKNTIVFFTLYLLSVSLSNLIASEPSEYQLPELPAEVIQNHIICYVAPLDMATVKQTSKCSNTWYDYWMYSTDYVEKMNEETCTTMLNRFACTEQTKNFEHFLCNNKEERKEALACLGWQDNDVDSIEKHMNAYRVGVKEGVIPDWIAIFKNQAAVTIVRLSNNPNKQDNYGNTTLIWASSNGRTEIVKLLLAQQNIDVNKQNNSGYTALILASSNGHSEIVELLQNHQ